MTISTLDPSDRGRDKKPTRPRVQKTRTEPLPSANVNIEAKLLGALIYDSQLIPLVRERLRFSVDRIRPFYIEAHQLLWQEMCTQYDAGNVPEYETLRDVLESTKRIERVGGESALWHLIQHAVDDPALNLSAEQRERVTLQWADRLRDHALRRASIDISTTAAGIGYPNPDTAEVSPHTDLLALSERLLKLVSASQPTPTRYRLLTISELLQLPDQDYLIDNILPQDSISMVYGEPGSGKSFLTLDMALCVAAGIPWHGHETRQGAIVYIAAEGGRGIKRRVDAWMRYRQCTDPLPFYVLDCAVPLLQPDAVQELIATLASLSEPPVIIFIDTLARSMDGGDENAAKDVNTVTAAADRIRQLHGGHVCIVHHSGKDTSRGARGSSALRGNVDTEIVVTKDENTIRVRCEKQKDDELFPLLTLTARKIALDEYATHTSLVLIDEPNAPPPPPVHLVPSRQQALDILATFPNGASATEWEHASKLARRTFYRVRDDLEKLHMVARNTDNDRVYYNLTEYGRGASATAN